MPARQDISCSYVGENEASRSCKVLLVKDLGFRTCQTSNMADGATWDIRKQGARAKLSHGNVSLIVLGLFGFPGVVWLGLRRSCGCLTTMRC